MCCCVIVFSATHPTDQGEESVVLLIVLGGEYFPVTHIQYKGVHQGFIIYFFVTKEANQRSFLYMMVMKKRISKCPSFTLYYLPLKLTPLIIERIPFLFLFVVSKVRRKSQTKNGFAQLLFVLSDISGKRDENEQYCAVYTASLTPKQCEERGYISLALLIKAAPLSCRQIALSISSPPDARLTGKK